MNWQRWWVLIFLTLASTFSFATIAKGQFMDPWEDPWRAPHSNPVVVGDYCKGCHSIHAPSYPTLLGKLCTDCHNGVSATAVKTHSSLTTSAKYGNWDLDCWACHEPHRQEQNNTYSATYGKYIRDDFATLKRTGAEVKNIDPNAPGPYYPPRISDTGLITINVVASAGTFTRSGGSYLTDGFLAGMGVEFTGFTNAGNNVIKTIQSVTADIITVTDNTGLANESGNGDERGLATSGIIRTVTNTNLVRFTGTNQFILPVGSFPDNDSICQACHINTSNYNTVTRPNLHTALGDASQPGGNCTECHMHNDGFVAKSCIGCHSSVQPPPPDPPKRRAIVDEFISSTSHHVAGGAVTDDDCKVCHYEAVDSTYHKNNQVDLRDPDTGRPITGFAMFSRDTTTNVLESEVTNVQNNFCLKCHDSDTSRINSNIYTVPYDAKSANNLINLEPVTWHDGAGYVQVQEPMATPPSSVRIELTSGNICSDGDVVTGSLSGNSITAHTPIALASLGGAPATMFSSNPLQPFSSIDRDVPDVYGQFNTSNPFHHAVRGAGNNPYTTPTATNGTNITMELPWNQTADSHDVISCFDCHGVPVVGGPNDGKVTSIGHGSANQRMLRTPIDVDRMQDKGQTIPAGMGLTVETFCLECHKASVYQTTSDPEAAGSIFEYHGAAQNQHNAGGGNELGCMGCHGGNRDEGALTIGKNPPQAVSNGAAPGRIHGGSFTWSSPSFASGTLTQHFMLGGWISGWQTVGSTGYCRGGNCNHGNSSKNYTR